MKIILIAAVNRKGVIGKRGKVPWHLPADLQRFKQLTAGHTVMMGRKTYESIGTPLAERTSVVLSRDPRFRVSLGRKTLSEQVKTFDSLDAALSALSEEDTVFVIGGGEIFRQTIGRADEIFVTAVENESDGDAFFPSTIESLREEFAVVSEEKHAGFTYLDFRKK